MKGKDCREVDWDKWNDWSIENKEPFFNGAKPSSKCQTEDCNVTGTGAATPKKGIGNGEKKLAMELLGNTNVGGGSKVSDITDTDRPHNFGHISIKEIGTGCKDVRLGAQVAESYHIFKGSFFTSLCTWLFNCYYQNEVDLKWKKEAKEAWPTLWNSILSIRESEDGELIEKIRHTLYDKLFHKTIRSTDTDMHFVLHDQILVGRVCAVGKIDAYKDLILNVQRLINSYREKFHAAIARRMSIQEGIPSDLKKFYYIKPEDFLESNDRKPVPAYIRDINFIALFIAVEAYPSDVKTSSTCLDEMVRNEALGGRNLHNAIRTLTESTCERSESKPVLIYVRESGFFPVGVEAYNEIICDRISEDKPKIGIKRFGLINRNQPTLGKHKASGQSPPAKSPAKSPAAKSPAKSSGQSPAAKKRKIDTSQSSS